MTAVASTKSTPKSTNIVSLFAEKRRAGLTAMLASMEKAHGKGAVQTMGGEPVRIDAISTGSLNFDAACGVGGIPKGRITEIYGPESSGKTTVTLQLIASVQRKGGIAAFVDAEHAFDPIWARRNGVDLDRLLISQPDHGEQALEIVDTMVRSGVVDLIIVDSVAALVPKAEIEGEMGDSSVGVQARLMSQAMRKLTPAIHQTGCTVVFINQLREKIGVMFGSPETTTGGKALKFYASMRIDIRRIGPVKDRENIIGSATRVKIVKNKVAPPFKMAEFHIRTDGGDDAPGGIDLIEEVLDAGEKSDIIQKSGAHYSMGETRMGQGREQARQWLIANPKVTEQITAQLRERLFGGLGANDARASGESDD